jgi:hypothetical protein
MNEKPLAISAATGTITEAPVPKRSPELMSETNWRDFPELVWEQLDQFMKNWGQNREIAAKVCEQRGRVFINLIENLLQKSPFSDGTRGIRSNRHPKKKQACKKGLYSVGRWCALCKRKAKPMEAKNTLSSQPGFTKFIDAYRALSKPADGGSKSSPVDLSNSIETPSVQASTEERRVLHHTCYVMLSQLRQDVKDAVSRAALKFAESDPSRLQQHSSISTDDASQSDCELVEQSALGGSSAASSGTAVPDSGFPAPRGIPNLTSSFCYVSSVLQALAAVRRYNPTFSCADSMFSSADSSEERILHSLVVETDRQRFATLQLVDNSCGSLARGESATVDGVRSLVKWFSKLELEHHDPSEFLIAILDNFYWPQLSMPMTASTDFVPPALSSANVFTHCVQETRKCGNCGIFYSTNVWGHLLTFTIHPDRKNSMQGLVRQWQKETCVPEDGIYCVAATTSERCMPVRHSKGMMLTRKLCGKAPSVVICNLSRGQFVSVRHSNLRKESFEFSASERFFDRPYRLISVVCRSCSQNASVGHYYAFVQLRGGHWLSCNDHLVKRTSFEDVVDQCASRGVLFFYQRDEDISGNGTAADPSEITEMSRAAPEVFNARRGTTSESRKPKTSKLDVSKPAGSCSTSSNLCPFSFLCSEFIQPLERGDNPWDQLRCYVSGEKLPDENEKKTVKERQLAALNRNRNPDTQKLANARSLRPLDNNLPSAVESSSTFRKIGSFAPVQAEREQRRHQRAERALAHSQGTCSCLNRVPPRTSRSSSIYSPVDGYTVADAALCHFPVARYLALMMCPVPERVDCILAPSESLEIEGTRLHVDEEAVRYIERWKSHFKSHPPDESKAEAKAKALDDPRNDPTGAFEFPISRHDPSPSSDAWPRWSKDRRLLNSSADMQQKECIPCDTKHDGQHQDDNGVLPMEVDAEPSRSTGADSSPKRKSTAATESAPSADEGPQTKKNKSQV